MSNASLLVGSSRAMQRVRTQCERFAPRGRTIVISGETGTGKFPVAEELHRRSGSPQPLIRITAAELRPDFIQPTLAGHTKGAFTSASEARRGLLAAASGTMVFPDDADNLKMASQPYLLDAMEGKPLRALGAERTFVPDVRWLIGLQRLPEELVRDRRLRPDLAARWGYLRIVVPPLRERREDIVELAPHLLARMAAEEGLPVLELDPDVLEALLRYAWPGNVRELDSALYAAMSATLADEAGAIQLHHLPGHLRRVRRGGRERSGLNEAAIAAALAAARGVVARAAGRLGVNRRTLYRRMREIGMRRAGGAGSPPGGAA